MFKIPFSLRLSLSARLALSGLLMLAGIVVAATYPPAQPLPVGSTVGATAGASMPVRIGFQALPDDTRFRTEAQREFALGERLHPGPGRDLRYVRTAAGQAVSGTSR
jgi:hypothetical protein